MDQRRGFGLTSTLENHTNKTLHEGLNEFEINLASLAVLMQPLGRSDSDMHSALSQNSRIVKKFSSGFVVFEENSKV